MDYSRCLVLPNKGANSSEMTTVLFASPWRGRVMLRRETKEEDVVGEYDSIWEDENDPGKFQGGLMGAAAVLIQKIWTSTKWKFIFALWRGR